MSASTASVYSDRPFLPFNGAATSLLGLYRGASTKEVEEPESGSSLSLWLSSGFSASVDAVQQSISSVWTDLGHWLAPQSPVIEDIEWDVSVLLPPKSRRMATVHVRHAGKAQPIIAVDADQTDAQPQPDILEPLEAAAQRGDERAFHRRLPSHRLANTVAQGARQGDQPGLALRAPIWRPEDLALQGAKRFPDHPEIREIRLRACAAKGRKECITSRSIPDRQS